MVRNALHFANRPVLGPNRCREATTGALAGTDADVRRGIGRGMREVPALQARADSLPPGRALVRAARAVQEGRCGQAGGPGRGSLGGGDGGAAPAAAVRAALRVGEPWDRRSPAVAST